MRDLKLHLQIEDEDQEILSRIEITRRTAMTYYWMYVSGGKKSYEDLAWGAAYKYRCLKKLAEDETREVAA